MDTLFQTTPPSSIEPNNLQALRHIIKLLFACNGLLLLCLSSLFSHFEFGLRERYAPTSTWTWAWFGPGSGGPFGCGLCDGFVLSSIFLVCISSLFWVLVSPDRPSGRSPSMDVGLWPKSAWPQFWWRPLQLSPGTLDLIGLNPNPSFTSYYT